MVTPDLTPARLEEIASLTREDIDAHARVRTHRVMAALHLSPALAARVIELEAEVERLRKREKFLRGISPSVAAMLDEYDTPTDAVLATANAD